MGKCMRLPATYVPRTYKGRVDWYVSLYSRHEPIHLFSTKQDAIDWAKTQPAEVVGGVEMTPSFDWFPAGEDPRDCVSRTRRFVDHRRRISKET